MIEERVRQGLFEPAWGPYRNAHFLVPRKNGKYHVIISAMSTNRHTLEHTWIPPNIEEFSKAFAGLLISSLTDVYYWYDHKMFHKDSRGYMSLQTTQSMCRPTTLVQVATNLVSEFVIVSRKLLNPNLGSITDIFLDNVGVKGPNSRYGQEEVEELPGVRRFVMEHLQNLNNVLADMERAGDTISGDKSNWCWNGVKMVSFVCEEAVRWPQE